MVEYISKAEIIGKLTRSDTQKKIKAMPGADAYNEFLALLNAEPKADVKIVEQGCWEEYMPFVEENPNNTTVKRRCSICKAPASPFMSYFCQTCGAQLRRDVPRRKEG